MNGSDMFENQQNSGATVAGPKLAGSLFVPLGMGIVFISDDGTYWQQRLALNPNGTVYIGDDGKPTIELIQVTL